MERDGRKHDVHNHEYQSGGPATHKNDASRIFTTTYRARACLMYCHLSADSMLGDYCCPQCPVYLVRSIHLRYVHLRARMQISGISKQMFGWCSRARLRVLPTKRFSCTDKTRTGKPLTSPCTRWYCHPLVLPLQLDMLQVAGLAFCLVSYRLGDGRSCILVIGVYLKGYGVCKKCYSCYLAPGVGLVLFRFLFCILIALETFDLSSHTVARRSGAGHTRVQRRSGSTRARFRGSSPVHRNR